MRMSGDPGGKDAMSERLRVGIRWWLVAACLAASLLPLWRSGEVAAELRRDRLAAAAYQRGIVLQVAGRLDEAAGAFRKVIAISPMAVEAYGSLAEVEFKRGRITEAIQAYRRLLAIYPYTYVASLYREVGLIELRAGRLKDARADLIEATAIDPNDWLAHHLLGQANYRLGDVESARTAWQRVVVLKPDFQPAYEQLRRLDGHNP